MSVQQRPSATSAPSDLEITAELPVLDVAAAEAAAGDDHLARTDTWAAPEPVSAARADGAVEAQLRALAENLRDVEERLQYKGARLVELEREIEQLGGERRAAAERAGAADDALRELAERDARIEALEAREAHLEACLIDADRRRGESVQAFERQVVEKDRTLATLQRDLSEAQETAASHLETLQTLEARRGIWDLLCRGLDQEIDDREARLAALGVELSRRTGHESDLENELAARAQRTEALEREVNSLATALSQREQQLRAAEEAAAAQLAAQGTEHARAAKTSETRIAAQAESIALLQRNLQDAAARAQELESDLRAAEDTIHRLEAELRSKSTRLEELAKASEEWRHAAETTRRSLEERDTRIHRLEADAASSVELVGNIKQSLQRLEPLTGVEPPPEGATRLLVRTSGDAEVVHVLGRKTTVGRTPDNDLQVDARFVSRRHAVILAGPVQTIIEDLNSTNGVHVNSRRVTRQLLKDGDIVVIGKTRFRFAIRQAAQRG